MRIGVDATALYGCYGGVEYSIWNLLSALLACDRENEYCVYIPHDGPPAALTDKFPSHWRWVRLPFYGAQKLKRIAWQQFVLPFQLRADDCDLLHAPAYVLPPLNTWWRPRIPTVLTVYDLIALDNPEFATRANRLHYRLLMPLSLRGASRVLVPSEAVRAAVRNHVPSAGSKTRVVPLGLEPIFFRTPGAEVLDELRARYDLPEKFLLFVGNFEPKKNLDNVLKAVSQLSDAPPLILAGGARAWSTLPQGACVRRIGYVPRRELPALYHLCSAFLFPSLAEGFGLPVLEALACGAPVVTSTRVPLPHLESVAVTCDPNSPNAIAAAIQKVLTDSNFAGELGRAGQEYARAFTWMRAARQTVEIYREAHQMRA